MFYKIDIGKYAITCCFLAPGWAMRVTSKTEGLVLKKYCESLTEATHFCNQMRTILGGC